jgi:hypothetical protein
MKKILFGAIVLLCLLSVSIKADPVVDDITLDPGQPSPGATVIFTAEVTGNQISNVYLIIQECKSDDFCFTRTNESMNKVENGKYEKSLTLKHSDATYIQYFLNINEGGTWYSFDSDIEKTYLKIEEDEDSSPGFELLVFIISLIILIFIIKKKRK